MTHLTPEEQTAVEVFRDHAKAMQAEADILSAVDCKFSAADYSIRAYRSTLAADAIEQRAAVRSENEALAGMVVQLREATESVKEIAENAECPACGASIGEHVDGGYYDRDADWTCHGTSPAGTEDVVWQIDSIKAMQAALSLALPEAAAMVGEWKERAELLELLVEADGKYAFGRSATAPGYFLMYKDKFISKLLLDSAPISQVIETIKADTSARAAKEQR